MAAADDAVSADAASPSTDLNAKAHFDLHGCRMTRPQLDRIWESAREGFGDDAYVSISTKRKGDGIESEISGKSIDTLLDGVQRSTLPGDPNILGNLHLYVSDGSLRNRSVSISIEQTRFLYDGTSVNVGGPYHEWVRGRAGVLKALLKGTRSSALTGRGRARMWLFSAGNILAAVVIGLLSAMAKHKINGVGGLFMAIGIWAVFGGG